MKRKLNKRSVALLVSLAVILTAAVSATLAYIFTSTNPVENTFTPAHVSCTVVENGEPTENYSGQLSVSEKKNVQIKNTGNTDAYIRVAIVVTWKAEDGTVYAQTPALGTDYTMTLDTTSGWSLGNDGYYYYASAVAPDGLTTTLISSATQNVTGPKDADGRQYYLSIEIVASAIQSSPTSVVVEQWGVTVDTDDKISKP